MTIDRPNAPGNGRGGANVLMGDGSVRYLKETTNPVTLRKLVSLKGGEAISADEY